MSIRFDDVGDYIIRSTDIPASQPITACWWQYIVTDTNAAAILFLMINSTFDAYQDVILDTNGTTLRNATNLDGANGSDLSVGVWYHVAYVRNGNSHTVYLNGVSNISRTDANTLTPAYLLMGSDSVIGLNGRLADIRIWTAALNQTQIQTEMNATVAILTTNLYGDYQTPSGATRVNDFSGNNRHWTATGTLTDEADPPYIVAITGSSAGVATQTATLTSTSSGALTGVAAGVASQSGAMLGDGALAGSSAGLSALAAIAQASGALSGAINGTASQVGALVGSGVLTGSAGGSATVAGTLDLPSGAVVGAVAGTSTATGVMSGDGLLIGLASGIASVVGTLSVSGSTGDLVGAADGIATCTATMLADGALIGLASVSATCDATLTANGILIGSVSGVSVLSGLLANISYSAPGTRTVYEAVQRETIEADQHGDIQAVGYRTIYSRD